MKAAKVIGIGLGSLFGLAVLGVLAAWVFLLRAPSPEDQCAHLTELMKKESGGLTLGAKFQSECPAQMSKGRHEGLYPYAERSKCVMQAQSLDTASKCGKDKGG